MNKRLELVSAWRGRLALRPSVIAAVTPDYRALLLAFVRARRSHLAALHDAAFFTEPTAART